MFVLAIASVLLASPAARAAPSTCADKWFEKAGPAPKAPSKPKGLVNPKAELDYQKALVAYRPIAARYAAEAKAFGKNCILGVRPRSQPTSKADAATLLDKYITVSTNFVASPPADVSDFCPGYASASDVQKHQFWREFFLAIIPPESGFNNASMMLDGDQYSIGLYQVSLMNGCVVKTESELTDPDKNTACAVHIMERLERVRQDEHGQPLNVIGGDGKTLAMGAASYWHTLRAQRATPTSRVTGPRASILAAVAVLDSCRAKR